MNTQQDIKYYAKRIEDQYNYMFEVITSDRTLQRKEELLQSATEMLSVITRGAPREYQFELVFVVAAGGVQYAHRCQQHYANKRKHTPLAGVVHGEQIIIRKGQSVGKSELCNCIPGVVGMCSHCITREVRNAAL